MIRSRIAGAGMALPQKVMTNFDLEKIVDTSHEWVVQRTGIMQRYIADRNETTVSLATEAALAAAKQGGVDIASIDLIIVATCSPDHTFPSVAVEVQNKLNLKSGFAFDVHAVCSGFVYALTTADLYIKTGMAKKALVIGSETISRLLDWNDRTTCVLFGDGAGALILEASEVTEGQADSGILTAKLRSDGANWDKLYTNGGVSTTQTIGSIVMHGREVFKHAVGMISDVVEDCFKESGYTAEDLDWFVPHQANRRIIDAAAQKLNIPAEKVVVTVDKYGNTSAASVPMALCTALNDGKIKRGDLVMLEAMGAGFTWGAVLLRW